MTEIKDSPIKGYTDQNKDAVDAVNNNKRLEEEVLVRIEALSGDYVLGCDQRWLSIAKTHIEEGFMAMNRAIFKPQRITK